MPASPELPGPPSKTTRHTAEDIEHFFIRGSQSASTKTICKPCQKRALSDPSYRVNFQFSASTSTSTLRVHLDHEHKDEYLRLHLVRGWTTVLPSMKATDNADTVPNPGSKAQSPAPFSQEAFLEHLVNFIIASDQSIDIVESPEFRQLLFHLRPQLDIPRQTTIRKYIIDAWRMYFDVLKRELADVPGRISFTVDIWFNQSRYPYLVVTAHWIARHKSTRHLKLRAALIAFHRLRGSRNGPRLANIVLQVLDRVEITAKGGHWTFDNASANDALNHGFMEALEELVRARDISFDHIDNRIVSFPHITNICATRVIESFTNIGLVDEQAEFDAEPPPGNASKQTYEEAVERDPIALCRSTVRAIRETGPRRDQFQWIISDGNADGWFRSPQKPKKTIKVPDLQLLHDIKTQWDSVSKMTSRFRELRPAIDYFLASPINKELAKLRMSDKEWDVLQDFETLLAAPNMVQQSMSAEKTPILSGAMPCFERFMTAWEHLGLDCPHLSKWTSIGIEWAMKYYEKMDATRAYVVAMVLNPSMRMGWIRKHWDDRHVKKAEDIVKGLMEEYRARVHLDVISDFSSSDSPHGERTVDEEFLAYTTATFEQDGNRDKDILVFWEKYETRFPTLFAIALDYLPIQASAVPSERVFSSSDTKRHNGTDPLLMEAQQILKFSPKHKQLNFTEGWTTAESEMQDDDDDDLLYRLLTGADGARDRIMASINRDDEDL